MTSGHTTLRLTMVSLGAIALASCSSSGSSNPSPPPPSPPASGHNFNPTPVGQLIAGSGTGYADNTAYRPNMRFPLLKAHAYANSQVYRPGGSQHPTAGQCNASNYDYPWQDNFVKPEPPPRISGVLLAKAIKARIFAAQVAKNHLTWMPWAIQILMLS